MREFELVASIVDLLRGKDREVWSEILFRTLKNEDPYATQVSKVKILEVLWPESVEPANLISHLQARKCEVDEKICAAFETASRDEYFAYSRHWRDDGAVMVEFHPAVFGIECSTYENTPFGAKAHIDYEKVVDAAVKHGFKQPNLVDALYFRNRFWEAHRYSEGTSYYVACKPIAYSAGKPPIIPVLDYDRYRGWGLRGREADSEHPLDMSHGTGQGEHFGSTFVFMLPERQ